MTTLNRNSSPNVGHLEAPTNCIACGKPIKYYSLTHHTKTSEYIGLDCWERLKAKNRAELQAKWDAEKDARIAKDKLSKHFGVVGEKIKQKVFFESVRELYTNSYGVTVHLNTFRTAEGNLITYKGKDLRGHYSHTMACSITGLSFNSTDKFFNDLYSFGIENGRYHTFGEPTACEKRTPEARRIEVILTQWQVEGKLTGVNAWGVKCDENNNLEFFNFQDQHDHILEFDTLEELTITGTIKENTVYN